MKKQRRLGGKRTPSVALTVRVKKDLHEILESTAKETDWSIARVITFLVQFGTPITPLFVSASSVKMVEEVWHQALRVAKAKRQASDIIAAARNPQKATMKQLLNPAKPLPAERVEKK